MAEFKIVGKIDLSKFELKKEAILPEKYLGFLGEELSSMSKETNLLYGNILDSEGLLTIEGPEAESHQNIIRDKEKNWASNIGLGVEEWKRKRDKNPSIIAEMAVVTLLHRFLKDRFLVARASAYDDYEYGMDNVLLDKETGSVICGFDQVLVMGQDKEDNKKKDKMEKMLLRGGAILEYGVILDEDKKIKRGRISNIPAFFLAITKKDLSDLLLDLKNNSDSSGVTKKILNQILISIKKQQRTAEDLLEKSDQNIKYRKLIDNLDKFKESFKIIEDKINLMNNEN